MTPGEATLLRLVAEDGGIASLRQRFVQVFPTAQVFDTNVQSLLRQGWLLYVKRGESLELTERGKEMLDAEIRAQELNLKEELGHPK